MNIYKFHSNPDELIGYTDRDWVFGDEVEKLILQGKEVTKVIGNLNLHGTPITALPDNLKVGGNLWLSGTKITSLPDNLKVSGNLYLGGTQITALPDNLTVHGDLWINSTPNLDTNNLPSSLVVNGEIMY